MSETWRSAVGYVGYYEISDLGRVRSLARTDRNGQWRAERFLKQSVTPKGYLKVDLSVDGVARAFRVHRLVLAAFVGPPPEGMEARHLDGNPQHNALSNLRWGTASENNRDRVTHGTHQEVAKTHCPQGHPYDGENLYVSPTTGYRRCRQCRLDRYYADPERAREAARNYYHANPEAARERVRQYRAEKKAS